MRCKTRREIHWKDLSSAPNAIVHTILKVFFLYMSVCGKAFMYQVFSSLNLNTLNRFYVINNTGIEKEIH